MNLTQLLEELENDPGAIAAWEVDKVGDGSLSVFRVDGGLAELAHTVVLAADRASVVADLEGRGLVTGFYGSMTGYVWQKQADTFTVWGKRGRVLTTDGSTLTFKRQTVAVVPGMEVVAFLDEDLIFRGVRITVGDASHVVAIHTQLRASSDASYGALDALNDCGWTVYLGRELADFLGVPLVGQTA